MSENEFKKFVLRQKGSVRPFVDDVAADADFPDAQSWDELEAYLRQRNPKITEKMLGDARYLWDRYAKEVLGRVP